MSLCGGDPIPGMKRLAGLAAEAAARSLDVILGAVGAAGTIVLVGGIGRGTTGGAIEAIAAALRAKGVPAVAVVSTPFAFESGFSIQSAAAVLATLRATTKDTVVVDNEALYRESGRSLTFADAFALASRALRDAVRRTIKDLGP